MGETDETAAVTADGLNLADWPENKLGHTRRAQNFS